MKKQKINIQTAALLTVATLGLTSPSLAQNVSISPTGNAPDNSAALDIRDYTDKGILIPRIALTGTTSAGPISNPANSLLVYNTTNNPAAGLTPGYYYNAGTTTSPIWVRLLNGGTPSDAWLTRGNAGTNPSTHFIGTTDNVDLVFRTNNTEKMRITAGGNVGIGTTTPGDKVEINGRLFLNYAGTPMIRLRTNVNFGGSTKGITEHQIFGPYNTSAGTLGALYIAAGKSSDDTKNDIIFYNDACAGPGGTYDCNVRRILLLGDTIYASGNVGIGTTTPAQKLEVCGNAKVVGQIIANSSNLSAGVTCSSDIRYKKDITPLTNALSNVMQLRGVNYFWKTKEFPEKQFPDTKQIGFIAQELEKVYPEVVFTDKDGYKSVDYSRLTPILVEAIKEQQKIIQQLQEENAQTKSEVKALAEKMNILINTLSAEKKVGNK